MLGHTPTGRLRFAVTLVLLVGLIIALALPNFSMSRESGRMSLGWWVARVSAGLVGPSQKDDRVGPQLSTETFVVNSTADTDDGVCNAGILTNCTLREAINAANASPGRDIIAFNIPGQGVMRISPQNELPEIVDPVVIDAYTQPGAKENTAAVGTNAVLRIELSGENAAASADGLIIGAVNSTVRGLVINRFEFAISTSFAINTEVDTGNVIEGCFIGTEPDGTGTQSSNGAGIFAVGTTIGGASATARNLISGPSQIHLALGSTNTVQGNLIGTDKTGTAGPGGLAIIIQGNNNTIGGTRLGEGNIIAFNQGHGLFVPAGNRNRILGNSIFSNEDLGINLVKPGEQSFPGVTPNDPGDTDTGPNNLQNFPELAFAFPDGDKTAVQGTLNSTANTEFRLEFFSNPSCDPSGHGEGQTFLGARQVSTDSDGNAVFTFNSDVVPAGQFITATATDLGGNTSEFSQCVEVAPTPPPTLSINDVTVNEGDGPSSGALFSALFTVTLSAPNIEAVTVNFATGDGTANAATDYGAAEGTLTFNPGQTSKSVVVPIDGDTLDELDETFSVNLSGPLGATIADGVGVATIHDDDGAATPTPTPTPTASPTPTPAPSFSVADVSVAEGNSGTTAAVFTLSLSQASNQVVSVDFTTADLTASAGSDYVSNSGTVIFSPGETSRTVNVSVNGDTLPESTEVFLLSLSNAANADIADAQGFGTITNDDALAILQFSAASYTSAEDCGAVVVTVTRSGDTSAEMEVDYSTRAGTASDVSDFTFAAGTIRFAAGETAKSFPLLLTEDSNAEGTERASLVLSNPMGGAVVGSPGTATLVILDDASEPSANSIDDPQLFVCQHYHDFLNRQPDPAGLAFWTGEITFCGTDVGCVDVKRTNVSAAFFLSIEFQETGSLVHRTYLAALGRRSLLPEFLADTQAVGRGIVVGAPGFEAQLELNQQKFFDGFVKSPDFLALYAGVSAALYVNTLNRNAGGVLSEAERNALISGLEDGSETQVTVLRKVVEDSDFVASEFNRTFVLMQYFGYLRRDPDEEGFQFWLRKLNEFGGDFQQAEMVKAFLVSAEYRRRFGQP